MVSRRKLRARQHRWARYMERISRSSMSGPHYPFGLSVTTVPGYFAPRREMRYRGAQYRAAVAFLNGELPDAAPPAAIRRKV